MQAVSRGSLTNEIQIQVDLTAMTTHEETGNSAITGYQLWWDNQSGIVDIIAVEDMSLTHVLIGLNSW